MLHFRNKPLPAPAERFLNELSAVRAKNTVNLYLAAISHFYRFLVQSKLDLSNMTVANIVAFDEDLARHNLKFITRRHHLQLVNRYLMWLEKNGEITDGTAKKLYPDYKGHHAKPIAANLPELAEQFITVLGAINKKNTVCGYRSCLRGFYAFHWRTGKPPYKIDRVDIESYMVYLVGRHIAPNQRADRLIQIRRYLDWLYEHKKLKRHPDELITSKDFPKREETLPRPYPVDLDIEIQRRLGESNEIDWLGLLLLRRCGLRVGELRNLTIDCVQSDLNSNWFLKVPLGKMNNERLIPLDPSTVEVVEKIKRHHSLRPEPGTKIVYLISNVSGRRRSGSHFGVIFQEVVKGLAIPGQIHIHRLRHTFATSLLSAGISITSLKALMGHRDIRMTLVYAAVTQETIRNEYFTALSKVGARYQTASFPLKLPDLRNGVNRSFYDAQKFIKKFVKENGNPNPEKLTKLLFRLNSLRHELSVLLKTDFHSK